MQRGLRHGGCPLFLSKPNVGEAAYNLSRSDEFKLQDYIWLDITWISMGLAVKGGVDLVNHVLEGMRLAENGPFFQKTFHMVEQFGPV